MDDFDTGLLELSRSLSECTSNGGGWFDPTVVIQDSDRQVVLAQLDVSPRQWDQSWLIFQGSWPRTAFITPPGAEGYDAEKNVGINNTESNVIPVVCHPKTYAQKLKIFTVIKERPNECLKLMYRLLLLMQFPVISRSGFQYGVNLCWFNVTNATAALIFTGEPYNFEASFVGLPYVAPMMGVTFAYVDLLRNTDYTGPGRLVNHLTLSVSNLPFAIKVCVNSNIVYGCSWAVFTLLGLILWGVRAARGVSGGALEVGMGLLGFTLTIGGGIPINYIVDSYKDHSGKAMITVIIIGNTLSFGFNYRITPSITASGSQNAMTAVAMISVGVAATFLPMVKWNKSLRKRSAKKYLAYVETVSPPVDRICR